MRNLIILLLILFFCSMNLKATVMVTAGAGGANVSADKAANSSTPAYTILLGKIYIIEGNSTDFSPNQTNVTLVLSAPTNWTFNPGTGTIARTGHGSFTGNTSISVTSTTITVTFSTSADITDRKSVV